jgi:hypothetical protein
MQLVDGQPDHGERPRIRRLRGAARLGDWFDLTGPPAVHGDNWLEVTRVDPAPGAAADAVIDEIEVWVQPKRS